MKVSRARVTAITALLLLLAGLVTRSYVHDPSAADPGRHLRVQKGGALSGLQEPVPLMPVLVQTARAFYGQLIREVTAVGTAEAARQLQITSPVTAKLSELRVREGQVVSGGELLLMLNDVELKLARDRARETVIEALARFAEKQMVLATNSGHRTTVGGLESGPGTRPLSELISTTALGSVLPDPTLTALLQTVTREEIVSSQVGLLRARADLQQAEIDLEATRIHAPFAGHIGRPQMVEGQIVIEGSAILTLLDTRSLHVRARVLEPESWYARLGALAEVHFAAHPQHPRRGQIEAVSPTVDSEARTLDVVVSVSNLDGLFKPGMFARVTLEAERYDDRLLVPAAA